MGEDVVGEVGLGVCDRGELGGVLETQVVFDVVKEKGKTLTPQLFHLWGWGEGC